MRKFFTIFILWVFLSLLSTANAQLINYNPDLDGEPWWANLPEITPEIQAELDAIPPLVLSPESYSKWLPAKVDNSEQIWFRDIFIQEDGSCGQASGVGYTFTYEVNRIRNLPANTPENQYPTHFTWNFLNKGSNSVGSWYYHGWNIIEECGIPSVADYGGLWMDIPNNWRVWMTGYEEYLKALDNRVIENYYSIDVSTPEGLNELKHWLNDHGDGATSGGLANFAAFMPNNNTGYATLTSESDEAGKSIILSFGGGGYHAMTIVGYNDNIKFDFNGDGQFTNPEYDMSQWEIGALKVANSWGISYYDSGFVYMPYRLLAHGDNRSIYPNKVHVLNLKAAYYTPELVLKTQVGYPCRENLSLGVGYGETANNVTPDSQYIFYTFSHRGGCYPMQGINNDPIELALDYNQKPEYNTSGKVYFIVNENDATGDYEGLIPYFSLFDYRWGEEFELPCNESNVSIINNGTTMLAIDYHLLPHEEEISSNLLLSSNRVSRFTTNVTHNATLEMNPEVKIDMYNSTITIDEGSLLKLNGKNKITAQRGNCKIVINGNIEIGENVVFEAAADASLEILFNNCNSDIILNNATFTNCTIKFAEVNQLYVNSSKFYNCKKMYLNGNISITNSLFIETSPYAYTVAKNRSFVFTNNSIVNRNIQGLTIEGYGNYIVDSNHINVGINNIGICIFNSGGGNNLRSNISNNSVKNSLVGIEVYNSLGSIYDNKVFNNNIGVKLLNISNISFIGSQTPLPEGQVIRDNSSYEIYISGNAFPSPFKFNKIIDDDNMGNPYDPLLYYQPLNNISHRDISYNYWGSNFNATEDLRAYSLFTYLPIWQPNTVVNDDDAVESMYLSAQELADNGNYSTANNLYRSLISQYPENIYAQSSMKELLNLEEYVGNDYSSLQSYYLTLNDSSLVNLADNLANKCNEKLGNWQQAIEWYENVIANPTCLEDSVFAVIDLHTLELQINGTRNGENTSDIQEFEEERAYLLSLLPGNTTINQPVSRESKSTCIELTNYPNPFKGNTSISFQLLQKGNVSITVNDLFGLVIERVQLGYLDSGKHKFTYNGSKLSPGIYFYSIIIDGNIIETNRMIINK